jgi:hypothetical protein
VTDDIEVHFDPGRGELSLSCGDEAFTRVRDAVVAAADLGDAAINGVPAGVRAIVVDRVPPPRSPARLRDRLALLGCGVVGFAVLFVLVVGLGTIAGWVR